MEEPGAGEGRAVDRAAQLGTLDRARPALRLRARRSSTSATASPGRRTASARCPTRACRRCRAPWRPANGGKVQYLGTFRRPGSGLGYQLQGYASGLERFNYFGPGNNTPQVRPLGLQDTRERLLLLARAPLRGRAAARDAAGPEVRYSARPPTPGRSWPRRRHRRRAVRPGRRARRMAYDSRQDAFFRVRADVPSRPCRAATTAVSGVRLQASGFSVPKAWDVTSRYGGVDGWSRPTWGAAGPPRGPRRRPQALGRLRLVRRGVHRRRERSRLQRQPIRGRRVALRQRVAARWLASLGRPSFPCASASWHSPTPAASGSRAKVPEVAPVLRRRPARAAGRAALVFNAVVAYSTEGYRFYFGFGYPF